SPAAIEAFFALSYIPAPLTIWKDIRKLPPASWMQIGSDLSFEERSYWDFKKSRCSSPRTFQEQAEIANALLQDAVKRRLVGDVPVALLLSGGVDSGLIAHSLATHGANVEAFTDAMEAPELDESQHAC